MSGEGWLLRKLKERRREKLLRRFGGIQTCPWCRQCAQEGDGEWRFDPWPENNGYDLLTCSVCGGTSIWLWGMGMHYMRELDPPKPAFPRVDNLIPKGNPHG